MKKKEIQRLLRKYRRGQCTASELKVIDRWYNSFEKDSEEEEFPDQESLANLKVGMFENISRRISVEEALVASPVSKSHKITNFQYLRAIAAMLLVGIGVGIFIYSRHTSFSNNTKGSEVTHKILSTESSKPGFTTNIYLSDGSVVWLKDGSTLEYPEEFTGETREVTLNGEAFFDVAQDHDRPFIIHSPNFRTRVLGTSFNIKAYENDESHEVVVLTGEVIVSLRNPLPNKRKDVILKPYEKAVYLKTENTLIQSVADSQEDHATYYKSKMVFTEVALEDIINVLNSEYEVNISLDNPGMRECIVTADLSEEDLQISLIILAKAVGGEYSTNGKDIIITGKGCGYVP